MDVDTASYTLARGALAAGKLPDPRHIRVEEFVNYFPEDVPAARDHVFSVRCEAGPSPFGEGLDLLKVTVKARDLLPGERKDAVLTFAVDTSGSMHEGDRLALVREALATLVRSLNPDDRVAVVGFSDHPYLVLPHTPAREADRILGAVASLTPRGDTNFEAGLALAYRVADEVLEPKAVHRVILCSDGVATAGARGAEEILKRVEVFAKRGIYLSCVGLGMGKYNDKLLETLADKGNGNYAYADDLRAAAEVFRRNLPATLQVLAQDAKVQVDFNPEVVSHYRLVGYENRDIADRDFRNDKVDAGEVGPGTTVTVLYEVLRRPGSSGDVGRVHVRYRDTGTGRVEEESTPLPPGVVATSLRETSDRFRFIACAAETAELLRGSYWARNGSYGKVLAVLHGLGAGFRARAEWGELAGLAARAQALTIRTLQGR
jgi:Ca-activated chloride channel family protein